MSPGDVVAIADSTGAEVVAYTYDAWGNPLTTTGSLASTLGAVNPLRYRGYVYDTETGLYYLQSRYYKPDWGKFISADQYVSTGQGVLGYNMFAYCENNPVTGYDPTGCFDLGGFLIGIAITVAAVGLLALTVATAGAASPLVAAAVTSVGYVVGVATLETGAAIAAAAATDSTAVVDLSVSNGSNRQKSGVSVVIDFGNDTAETYTHTGISSSSDHSVTYGAGIVMNYDSPGDYGGDFLDLSASTRVKGFDYGVDVCFSPGLLNGGGGTAAYMGTVGFSLPGIDDSLDITAGYDYYTPYAIISW